MKHTGKKSGNAPAPPMKKFGAASGYANYSKTHVAVKGISSKTK